jgi:hypothetical protein
MTPAQLLSLRELAKAATPGPHRECGSEVLIGDHWWRPASYGHYRNNDDARWIAACSPSTVLALLDLLDARERKVEGLLASRDDADDAAFRRLTEIAKLHDQLAAVKAALVEACDIGDRWAICGVERSSGARRDLLRITALRLTGSQP